MATKAKASAKAPTRGRNVLDQSKLPPGVDAALSKAQVIAALAISPRKFAAMLSTGEFPRAEFYVGDLPRWICSGFNAWVAEQKRRHGAGTGGRG